MGFPYTHGRYVQHVHSTSKAYIYTQTAAIALHTATNKLNQTSKPYTIDAYFLLEWYWFYWWNISSFAHYLASYQLLRFLKLSRYSLFTHFFIHLFIHSFPGDLASLYAWSFFSVWHQFWGFPNGQLLLCCYWYIVVLWNLLLFLLSWSRSW